MARGFKPEVFSPDDMMRSSMLRHLTEDISSGTQFQPHQLLDAIDDEIFNETLPEHARKPGRRSISQFMKGLATAKGTDPETMARQRWGIQTINKIYRPMKEMGQLRDMWGGSVGKVRMNGLGIALMLLAMMGGGAALGGRES